MRDIFGHLYLDASLRSPSIRTRKNHVKRRVAWLCRAVFIILTIVKVKVTIIRNAANTCHRHSIADNENRYLSARALNSNSFNVYQKKNYHKGNTFVRLVRFMITRHASYQAARHISWNKWWYFLRFTPPFARRMKNLLSYHCSSNMALPGTRSAFVFHKQ